MFRLEVLILWIVLGEENFTVKLMKNRKSYAGRMG
jgi:hypothetical protein